MVLPSWFCCCWTTTTRLLLALRLLIFQPTFACLFFGLLHFSRGFSRFSSTGRRLWLVSVSEIVAILAARCCGVALPFPSVFLSFHTVNASAPPHACATAHRRQYFFFFLSARTAGQFGTCVSEPACEGLRGLPKRFHGRKVSLHYKIHSNVF